MADFRKLDRAQFDLIYDSLKINDFSRDFLYELYGYAEEGAGELAKANTLGLAVPINPVYLILYLVNETNFFLNAKKRTLDSIKEDNDVIQVIVSTALDKYYTNEHLNFQNETKISRFSPLVSTLSLYVNFVLGVLSRYKKRVPKQTLLTDILQKSFSIMKAIIELLCEGFDTEAFSTWRTLHESECILILLVKNGDEVIKTYLRHLDYSMAYRGVIASKEEVDNIFLEIKAEMKELELKSKDMKKFIEYGWLRKIPGALENESFKYNFRDGVERLAGLSSYSKSYEMASEIAHSSPLLIYSKNEYFLHLVLLNLYESFFRIENIFTHIYLRSISREEANRYLLMRNVYFNHLEYIYQREKAFFSKITDNKKNA